MERMIMLTNCNCNSNAKIYFEENSLNIKYGSNRTGRSIVCMLYLRKRVET